MKFTLSWLKDYLDTNAEVKDIIDALNAIGLEVEEVTDNSKALEPFNCVKIEECIDHPDSDHLHICNVRCSNNSEPLTIICGAPNVRVGLKTILAPIDSVLPNGIIIKKSKIRGVDSCGMLCSLKELNLGEENDGIIELEDDVAIGTNIVNILHLDNDLILDVDLTPNRGDCLGVYGIARDLAAYGIGKLKEPTIYNIENKFKTNKSLLVNDKHCYYYSFRHLKDLKNCSSPLWLQNRLKSIGVNPRNAIVDITNYVMFSLGQPLHAYDYNRINGDIYVKTAGGKEIFIDLFNNPYDLKGEETLICDAEKILCLGGIIGGIYSSVDNNSNEIILEAAVFDPINIARTARQLNINTDAKYRFERGVDFEMPYLAINLATKLILDICGGQASNLIEFIDGDYRVRRTKTIELNINKINSLLGIEVDNDTIIEILNRLGYKIVNKSNDLLNLLVPSWKNNILVYQDIIDDFIRIYGYDHLKDQRFNDNHVFEKPGNKAVKRFKNRLNEIRCKLVENKMTEVILYSFSNEDDSNRFKPINKDLTLLNPIVSDLSFMRQSLLPNMLRVLARNVNRNFNDLSLFEIGRVFNSAKPEDENTHIVGVDYGNFRSKNIYNDQRKFDIFDVKKDLWDIITIIYAIDPNELKITRDVPSYYHPNRSGAVMYNNNILGYFGELNRSINNYFDLEDRINVFEFFIDNIPDDSTNNNGYRPNNFNSIAREFTFVFNDNNIEVGPMVKTIGSVDKNLITDVRIIDIYNNDTNNQKSVSFRVTLQPIDRNLVREEIDDLSARIIALVQSRYGGGVRTE